MDHGADILPPQIDFIRHRGKGNLAHSPRCEEHAEAKRLRGGRECDGVPQAIWAEADGLNSCCRVSGWMGGNFEILCQTPSCAAILIRPGACQ
jgi:hypothetical protein